MSDLVEAVFAALMAASMVVAVLLFLSLPGIGLLWLVGAL